MGRVGRFSAVVRAMSLSACSADVGLLVALANCTREALVKPMHRAVYEEESMLPGVMPQQEEE